MGFLLILHTAITEWEMIYQVGLLLHLMFALSRSMMTFGLKKSGIRKYSNGKSFTNQKYVKRLLVIPMSFTFTMMQLEKMVQSLAPLLITIHHMDHFHCQRKLPLFQLWTTPCLVCAWERGAWSLFHPGLDGQEVTMTPLWWS